MSRVAPRKVIARLAQALEVARAGIDPEGVHQARVATRRLRVWLELARHDALDADLRWLGRSLSPLRDLDVLCEGPLAGAGSFGGFLEREHADAKRKVRETLAAPRVRALVAALRALPAAGGRGAAHERARLEAKLAKDARRLFAARGRAHDEQLARAHRLRRALRKVRYAREWLGQDADGFSDLQDALGALIDVAALERHVRRFGDEGHPVAKAMLARLERALGQQLELVQHRLGPALMRVLDA